MSFSRFLFGLAITFLLALSAIAVFPLIGLARPDADTTWTASLYTAKIRDARAVHGPRILVVGGSGALFSFDAEVASRRIGRPVVNFGTHAGLGLPYILDRASRELRSGDDVVLLPEYELLQQNRTPTELAIRQAVFFDREFVDRRPRVEAARYLVGYGVIDSLVEGAKWVFHGPPAGRSDVSLDASGDVRGNTVARSKDHLLEMASPILPPPPVSSDMLSVLAQFRRRAEAVHARVFVLPPAHISTPGYRKPAFRNFQRSLEPLFAALSMPMLAPPESAMLPPKDMYDTEYHANDNGRAVFTALVLSKLCTVIICTGPTTTISKSSRPSGVRR